MKNLHRICILYDKHNTDEKSIDCTRYIVFRYARVGIFNINDLLARTARLKVGKTDTFITTAAKRLTKNNYIYLYDRDIFYNRTMMEKKKTVIGKGLKLFFFL